MSRGLMLRDTMVWHDVTIGAATTTGSTPQFQPRAVGADTSHGSVEKRAADAFLGRLANEMHAAFAITGFGEIMGGAHGMAVCTAWRCARHGHRRASRRGGASNARRY